MLGMINKIHVKTKERKTVTGLGRPEALAVDWITDNVYFNNNDYSSSIEVDIGYIFIIYIDLLYIFY